MSPFDSESQVARHAVQAAGESLLSWEELPQEEWKGRIDPVSAADREAEQAAVSVLRDAFPNDLVLGEEGTQLTEHEVSGKRRWYLDPLDGTTNFLRGRPHWCVSLALVDSTDEAVCAAVLAPTTGDLFLGVIGEGATCSGEPLNVRESRSLDRAIVSSGFPYSFDNQSKTNLAEWSAVTVEALAVRCSGTAALDLCDVARGRLDAFWEMELAPWDTVAGALIARETGALTTPLDGAKIRGVATDVLAAPPSCMPRCLEFSQGRGHEKADPV
jgi:myo-inositol-1(or 4)-monophosphatase